MLKDKIKLNSFPPPSRIDKARGRNRREINNEEKDKYFEMTTLRSIYINNHSSETSALLKIKDKLDDLYKEGIIPAAIFESPDGKFYI